MISETSKYTRDKDKLIMTFKVAQSFGEKEIIAFHTSEAIHIEACTAVQFVCADERN
jgi:hypothetical protein